MKAISVLLVLFLSGISVSFARPYDVTYDYDKKFNFAGLKTYGWMPVPEKGGVDSFVVQRVKNAVNAELKYTKEDLSSGISLMRAARSKGGVSWQQIVGALASVGIAASGLWIVAAAIADPEPTTKLGLLVGGGLTLILTGSLGILANLGTNFSVSVRSPQGHEFEIKPEFSV